MSEAFSQSPPVYANRDTNNLSTPYPMATSIAYSNGFSFPYNASTLISSASLPLSNASTTHSKFHHYKFK